MSSQNKDAKMSTLLTKPNKSMKTIVCKSIYMVTDYCMFFATTGNKDQILKS